jgi:hypothetical protein
MSIEAMKQALDALEGIHPGNMTPMAEESWNKAITALRTAIEQAEKQEPRPWSGLTDDEIKEIIGPWGDTPIKGYTRKLFDQIEAKLKAKNP